LAAGTAAILTLTLTSTFTLTLPAIFRAALTTFMIAVILGVGVMISVVVGVVATGCVAITAALPTGPFWAAAMGCVTVFMAFSQSKAAKSWCHRKTKANSDSK
jgi:uncharacterized membrane protein